MMRAKRSFIAVFASSRRAEQFGTDFAFYINKGLLFEEKYSGKKVVKN